MRGFFFKDTLFILDFIINKQFIVNKVDRTLLPSLQWRVDNIGAGVLIVFCI